MILIDIHWPTFKTYKLGLGYRKIHGISPEFAIYRVLERLKFLHGEFVVHDIYLGGSDLDDELYEDFRSACAKQSIQIQAEKSSNPPIDEIFYYVSHFSVGLDEKSMREEARKYIVANMTQVVDGNSKGVFIDAQTDYGLLESEVKPFSHSKYKNRYILDPFSLGRYDAFYMINDAGLNTTSPLRRYSSALEPHYTSFSPLGGLYVFYNCCTENISTMGHRFSDQYFYEIINNREDYYIIAIFGGSSAYSIFCADSEQFGAKLSQHLNGKNTNVGNKKIVMINFSLPGSTIFEARLCFTMEASKIKPDLCILHFGWNESRYGPLSHPSLAKLGIYFSSSSYSNLLRSNHSVKGHVTEDLTSLPSFPSIPQIAFAKYLYESILEFNEMVERYESKLIVGLQPIIRVKRPYHNRLHQFLAFRESTHGTKYQETLYQEIPQLMRQNNSLNFINVDECLYQMEPLNKDNDSFVFMDSCHLNARGDAFVAEIYSQFIVSSML